MIKIAVFIALAPLIGIILGYLFMVTVYWICRRRTFHRVDRWFRRLQLISAAVFSLGHGTNDAQKTMGIITVLVYSTVYLECEFQVPFWVVLICHAAIALGTLAGGWRVIETLGMKITKLKPVHGFCAETPAAFPSQPPTPLPEPSSGLAPSPSCRPAGGPWSTGSCGPGPGS